MNRKQRMKNRETAKRLHAATHCDRCGMAEGHFVISFEPSEIEAKMGATRQGFYVCPDLYEPGENGKRKDMSDIPPSLRGFDAMAGGLAAAAVMFAAEILGD
jgi:hypothetical protein